MYDIMLLQAQQRIDERAAWAERARARKGHPAPRTSRQDVADRIRHRSDTLDS